jgi:hypothetical protein
MAYSQSEIERLFDKIIERIENGEPIRRILDDSEMPTRRTFYKWLVDKDKVERYARAAEIRADFIFEEMFEIADHTSEDHTPFTGSNVVQRDRLRIDTRKWALSKMNPKKYGDKTAVEHSGEIKSEKTIIEFRDYSGKTE